MLTAADVGRALSVSPATFTPDWEQAMSARPAGVLPFLDPATVPPRRLALGLPQEVEPILMALAVRIQQDPALAALAWYLNWRLFCDAPCGPPQTPPDLTRTLGDQSGTFYLLVALEFAVALPARHRAWGYPDEVTAQTLRQVRDSYDNHWRGTGRVGHYPNQLGWLRTFFNSPYVRLGRLAFQIVTLDSAIEVWRRRHDRELQILMGDGMRIDSTGLIARRDEPAAWTTTLRHTDTGVEGFPVDPAGRAARQPVRLDREWECLIHPGDEVLSIHIPPGGRMDPASVQDSFRQAARFFATHHPDRPLRAFDCRTWFLDPRLAELLPPDANPLRFQRSLHLYPIEPHGDGGLWFVFLRDTSDLPQLPRDTSVQRVLIKFLEAGRRWNGGGGLLPFEDAIDLVERAQSR